MLRRWILRQRVMLSWSLTGGEEGVVSATEDVDERHLTTMPQVRTTSAPTRLDRRNTNPTIHARTFLRGKTVGKSTGETTLAAASKIATDWYLAELDSRRTGNRPSSTAPLFGRLVLCRRLGANRNGKRPTRPIGERHPVCRQREGNASAKTPEPTGSRSRR